MAVPESTRREETAIATDGRAGSRGPGTRRSSAPRSPFRPTFPLVEAKLHPPAARPGTISRGRLVRHLRAEPRPPVVAVIAPPGFGKTLLLAEFAARDEGAVAWLSLDDFDNDPSVFLTYVAAAFDRIEPIEPGTANALAAQGPRILASPVPRLAAELHRWRAPATLVFDDVHRLVDRTCLDALAALIDHLPAGLQVVLVGRTEPDLPFGRYRAGRDLREIGRRELGLDADEAGALTAAAGHAVSREEATALVERTEGWAAGIYLTVLARERPRASGDEGEAAAGRDDYVAEFLWSEMLSGLDDDDLALLTRTSILEVILPPVADAVAGSTGTAGRLDALARANGLIARGSGAVASYRCHPLLRDCLRAELERREPGIEPDLHGRAASAYAAAGRSELAIEHALAGRDVDAAADLVATHALRTYYGGHSDRLARWLRSFDDNVLERHMPLAVIAALVNGLYGRPEVAEHLAAIVERSTHPTAAGPSLVTSGRAMLRVFMARGDPRAMLADATAAVDAEVPGASWRYLALYMLGAAHVMLGDPTAADAALADGVNAAVEGDHSPFYGLALRASLAIDRADWQTAERYARDSHVAYERTRLGEVATALLVHAVSARVAIHRGDRSRAKEELVHAQLARAMASRALPWTSVGGLLDLARAYVAVADVAGARSAVLEAEQIARHHPDLGVVTSQLAELRRTLDAAPLSLAGPSTLTPAELRLLPILSTPLSFREIGERMYLSPHTVKTQAISIYGKLEASSRTDAVERAIELGLLEPFPALARRRPTATD